MTETAVARAVVEQPSSDLLGLTEALVAVPSVSHEEGALADAVEERLRRADAGLEVSRWGDNVVARTDAGRARRIVIGGHLDTVPPNDNLPGHRDDGVLVGLGAADMKGGLAGMLRLAEEAERARDDVTFVFYAGEEVADEHNGLRELFAVAPEAVAGDLAILLEPTAGWVEAGCQGSLHLEAEVAGARAHTARPWMGENALHRAGVILARLGRHEAETVDVEGLAFRESLEAVEIHGGVARNVVPDRVTIVVNRRFAPSRTVEAAIADTVELLQGVDRVETVDVAPAAPPNLSNPVVAEFVGTLDLAVRPKLGWTDVARFTAHGIPALNFGPGDPELAHTPGERVDRESVEGCYAVLAHFLGID